MSALADKLAVARREADAALRIARDVSDNPARDPQADITTLATATAVLAAAVIALADYTETPF